MAVAYVQNLAAAPIQSAAPLVLTVGANTTVGNMVVVAGRALSSRTVTSVADSRGNTWTVDFNGSATTGLGVASCVVAAGKQIVSGDTITITFSASAGTTYCGCAVEFSGQLVTAGAAVVDQTGTNSSAANTVTAVTSVGTAAAGDLVIGVAAQNNATGGTFNITSPDASSGGTWTDLDYPVPVAQLDLAYQIAGGAGQTFSAAWTCSSATAMAADIVAYKAAALAAPLIPQQLAHHTPAMRPTDRRAARPFAIYSR